MARFNGLSEAEMHADNVVIEGYVDELEARTGSLTETAPANDTASSGLNGRLQRIAQNITSYIGSKAAGTAAASAALVGGVYNTAAPAPTNGQQVAIQLDAVGNLKGALTGLSASATFTPANSSHVANDCVGAAAQFSFGAQSGCTFMITDANLLINTATAQATAWRLYLYNVTPPSATADDGAWDLPSGDQASFLGYIDLGTAADLGSTQWIENRAINKTVKLSGTSVFGYLTNLTTATTLAVAHTVTLIGTPV